MHMAIITRLIDGKLDIHYTTWYQRKADCERAVAHTLGTVGVGAMQTDIRYIYHPV